MTSTHAERSTLEHLIYTKMLTGNLISLYLTVPQAILLLPMHAHGRITNDSQVTILEGRSSLSH